MRDSLPAHQRSFAPEWQQAAHTLEMRARQAKDIRKEHNNRSTRILPTLEVGNHVLIQHPTTKCWSTPGIVVEIGKNRDYLLKTPAGRILRRNRRFIRRRIPVMPGTASNSSPAVTEAAPGPLPTPARRSTRTKRPIVRFEAGSRK